MTELNPIISPSACARPKVLIAEDEAIVALDLQMMFEDLGAHVLGPCATLRAALSQIAAEIPDVAVLDVMLADGEVYELADRLQDAGVTLVFHSGHACPDALNARYPGAAICPKPAYPAEIEATLEAVLSARAPVQPRAHEPAQPPVAGTSFPG